MRSIAKLAEHIEEETRDVCSYTRLATCARDDGRPEVGKVLVEIAQQRVNYADKIHSAVLLLIDERKSQGADVP